MEYFIINGKLIQASKPSSALGIWARNCNDRMKVGQEKSIDITRISQKEFLDLKRQMEVLKNS